MLSKVSLTTGVTMYTVSVTLSAKANTVIYTQLLCANRQQLYMTPVATQAPYTVIHSYSLIKFKPSISAMMFNALVMDSVRVGFVI